MGLLASGLEIAGAVFGCVAAHQLLAVVVAPRFRSQAVIVFTDVVGSTEILDEIGDAVLEAESPPMVCTASHLSDRLPTQDPTSTSWHNFRRQGLLRDAIASKSSERGETAVHVRITQLEDVKDVDKATAVLRDEILPGIKGLKGFRGITASADRSTGTVAILSMWDSEADQRASAEAITQLRDSATESIGGRLGEVRSYEQLLQEVTAPPEPGSRLLVTPTKMDPGKIEQNLAFFKANVLPDIMSIPGFRAVRYLVDRQAGEGMVGVVLTDESSVKEAEARAEKRRGAAAQQGVELGQRVQREVIFSAIG